MEPKVADVWSSLIQTLEGHTDNLKSAVFSRDGCWMLVIMQQGPRTLQG